VISTRALGRVTTLPEKSNPQIKIFVTATNDSKYYQNFTTTTRDLIENRRPSFSEIDRGKQPNYSHIGKTDNLSSIIIKNN